jgi:prepilin-type N-terminal cleavage/methylation domain-containing protein
MQKIKNISNGFTLAEVLITLAVIGVVAALTIPTVVRNYQKTQTITQLKKVYSALSNTTNLAIADEGPISGWEIGENGTGEAAVDFANRYLIPYLKVSKNCENKTTSDCALVIRI